MVSIRFYRDAGLIGSRWDIFIRVEGFGRLILIGIQFRPFLIHKEVRSVAKRGCSSQYTKSSRGD